MMEENGYIELFERYRNGDLSEGELREFEARLVYDSEFKESHDHYETIETGIKTHFRNELKFKLEEVDKAMDETPKKSSIIRLIAWTSSVAAAILIGVFVFQYFSKPNHEQLAKSHWPHEEGLPVKMSTKGRYDDAMNAYKLKNWDLALKELGKITSDTATYYAGLIFFKKNEFENSLNSLNKIQANSVYFNEAKFRKALNYLALDKKIESKTLLIEIKNDETSIFIEKAKEILEKL